MWKCSCTSRLSYVSCEGTYPHMQGIKFWEGEGAAAPSPLIAWVGAPSAPPQREVEGPHSQPNMIKCTKYRRDFGSSLMKAFLRFGAIQLRVQV